MPGRITPLINEEYYHIFNRGSDRRNIFLQSRDYKRFQQTFYYYHFLGPKPKFSQFTKSQFNLFTPNKNEQFVDIICYCLMPNHFHFLVKQLKTNGISLFMSQLSNSYTKYFNTKYKRIGALLQGTFKAVRIESGEQLLHVSRYIHLNPIVSGITKDLDNYPWSSYHEFVKNEPNLCTIDTILNLIPKIDTYKQFVQDQIAYGTSLEIIKHQLIDINEV